MLDDFTRTFCSEVLLKDFTRRFYSNIVLEILHGNFAGRLYLKILHGDFTRTFGSEILPTKSERQYFSAHCKFSVCSIADIKSLSMGDFMKFIINCLNKAINQILSTAANKHKQLNRNAVPWKIKGFVCEMKTTSNKQNGKEITKKAIDWNKLTWILWNFSELIKIQFNFGKIWKMYINI